MSENSSVTSISVGPRSSVWSRSCRATSGLKYRSSRWSVASAAASASTRPRSHDTAAPVPSRMGRATASSLAGTLLWITNQENPAAAVTIVRTVTRRSRANAEATISADAKIPISPTIHSGWGLLRKAIPRRSIAMGTSKTGTNQPACRLRRGARTAPTASATASVV